MFIVWAKVPISAHGRAAGQMFIGIFSILFGLVFCMGAVVLVYLKVNGFLGQRPSNTTEGQMIDGVRENTQTVTGYIREAIRKYQEELEQGPEGGNLSSSEKLAKKLLTRVFGYLFLFIGFVFLVYTIIGIELMLVWNEITDINSIASIGQLVPFIAGLIPLCEVILDLLGSKYSESF
jgi:ABC-type multidrug transport system fused ATPase/permease subunit